MEIEQTGPQCGCHFCKWYGTMPPGYQTDVDRYGNHICSHGKCCQCLQPPAKKACWPNGEIILDQEDLDKVRVNGYSIKEIGSAIEWAKLNGWKPTAPAEQPKCDKAGWAGHHMAGNCTCLCCRPAEQRAEGERTFCQHDDPSWCDETCPKREKKPAEQGQCECGPACNHGYSERCNCCGTLDKPPPLNKCMTADFMGLHHHDPCTCAPLPMEVEDLEEKVRGIWTGCAYEEGVRRLCALVRDGMRGR